MIGGTHRSIQGSWIEERKGYNKFFLLILFPDDYERECGQASLLSDGGGWGNRRNGQYLPEETVAEEIMRSCHRVFLFSVSLRKEKHWTAFWSTRPGEPQLGVGGLCGLPALWRLGYDFVLFVARMVKVTGDRRTAVQVLALRQHHAPWQPSGPGHFDSLIPGLRLGAVVFVGWIVAELRKSGFITGLHIVVDLGRNLITLLIWEISSKPEDIFCFQNEL